MIIQLKHDYHLQRDKIGILALGKSLRKQRDILQNIKKIKVMHALKNKQTQQKTRSIHMLHI